MLIGKCLFHQTVSAILRYITAGFDEILSCENVELHVYTVYCCYMYMYCHHRKTLQRILKKQGIDFKMNTKVTSAERLGSGEIQVDMEAVKGGKTDTHL